MDNGVGRASAAGDEKKARHADRRRFKQALENLRTGNYKNVNDIDGSKPSKGSKNYIIKETAAELKAMAMDALTEGMAAVKVSPGKGKGKAR